MNALESRSWRWLAVAVLLIAVPVAASAQDKRIGTIKLLDGLVTITHGQLTFAASIGGAIYQDDLLRTYWDGQLGVTFKDNTRISLGPSSRLTVTQFVFVPAQQQYGFILLLIDGTMQYLSGLTAKLAPDAMKIETPTATIGVRGTRFLARVDR
jgi:hypothetical protein